MREAHKTPCNDMSCPQFICENRHKDLTPLRQTDSSYPAPSPSEGELEKALAWADNGAVVMWDDPMPKTYYRLVKSLAAAYRSLLTESVKMEAVVEAAKDVFKVKRPVYHDCLDDGLPECEWCLLEKAIASHSKTEGGAK